MAPSTVRLTFSGLLVLHAREGAPHCDVGIPRHVPHNHEPVMNIAVRTGLGSITLLSLRRGDFEQTVFRLRAENCPQSDAVTLLHGGQFSRRQDVGHENDFRWVVDFEGELYRKEIGHVYGGWLSWLRVGGGHFYTDRKSVDELVTYTKGSHPSGETLGRAAVRVGARVDLAGPDSRVVLQKRRDGERTWEDVFTCLPAPGVHYEIDLSQTLPEGALPHPGEEAHADFYYHAVGSRLSDEEKKFFRGADGPGPHNQPEGGFRSSGPVILIDPRVICFIGDMSLTPGDDSLFADPPPSKGEPAGGVPGPHEHGEHRDHGAGDAPPGQHG